mgnify:CR=1 FL=1
MAQIPLGPFWVIKRLSVAYRKMELIGKFVNNRRFRSALAKQGFSYNKVTNKLSLSYPHVPKEFSDQAVEITLYRAAPSLISEIHSIAYYCKGSGYEKASPKKGFEKYVRGILKPAMEVARPTWA